jgi:hypothetical protein
VNVLTKSLISTSSLLFHTCHAYAAKASVSTKGLQTAPGVARHATAVRACAASSEVVAFGIWKTSGK